MTLLSRIQRIERSNGSDDPFANLTDEELQAAIAVREQIEAAVGMPEADYAAVLAGQIKSGELPADIDRRTAEAFVRDVSRGRTAHV